MTSTNKFGVRPDGTIISNTNLSAHESHYHAKRPSYKIYFAIARHDDNRRLTDYHRHSSLRLYI